MSKLSNFVMQIRLVEGKFQSTSKENWISRCNHTRKCKEEFFATEMSEGIIISVGVMWEWRKNEWCYTEPF
jgi:hypothetical protein